MLAPLVLALSALSTAAVLPRSDLGSWNVTIVKSAYANGYRSEVSTAVYTSESYPEGVSAECRYVLNPAVRPAESSSCDEGFSVEYDGKSKCSVFLGGTRLTSG